MTRSASISGSSLDNSIVRWCCISDAELRKCEEWALSIKSDPLVCVQATSMTKCIEMIKVGDSLWSGYKTAQGAYVLSELERKTSLRNKWEWEGIYAGEFPASREVVLLGYTIHANPGFVFVIFSNAAGRVVRLMRSPWMQRMCTLQGDVDWCL